jgi:hypothetical protein
VVAASRPWRAILADDLRRQALHTARTIAESLESLPVEEPSLVNGAAGLAVSFAYFGEGLAEPKYEEISRRLLDRALALAQAEPMAPSLYSGLPGIGWAASRLSMRFQWSDLEVTLTEIDEAIHEDLNVPEWKDDFGLGGGLTGLGVYALERLNLGNDAARQVATMCFERIINLLAATAEHKPEGAAWWRGPERLSLHARKKMPDGSYSVGMEDGVPGVVAFLARACAAGVAVDRARPLLDDAARWVLAQEAPDGPPEGFPYAIRPNKPQRNWTRSSWAFGDPGVAAALLAAGRCVGEPAWEERAITAALRATTRPPDRTRIFDAGLAIGAAGLAHVFNRLYQATGESRLVERSRFWFSRALEMRRPGQGIAGYASWMPDENDIERWWDSPGIIYGAAGIALALLSAATELEPSWDSLMLLDVPPRLKGPIAV